MQEDASLIPRPPCPTIFTCSTKSLVMNGRDCEVQCMMQFGLLYWFSEKIKMKLLLVQQEVPISTSKFNVVKTCQLARNYYENFNSADK